MLQTALKRSACLAKSRGNWGFLARPRAFCRPASTIFNTELASIFRRHGIQVHAWHNSSQTRPCLITSQIRIYHPQNLDARFFSLNGSHIPTSGLPVLSPPAVGRWLLTSSALVFAVIVVGGVTRLTESGLSITEWRPITGILPPLSQAEWDEEFDKYKATPEFKL
jgi:Cytochrome oxidase assembly protein